MLATTIAPIDDLAALVQLEQLEERRTGPP